MASNSTAAAAARRRKIVERGADRLALITGRLSSLPPESSSDANLKPSADSSPQPNSDHQLYPPPHLLPHGVAAAEPVFQPPNPPPNQIEQPLLQKTNDSVSGEEETFGRELPEQDTAAVDSARDHVGSVLDRPVSDEISGRSDLNPTAMGAASGTEQLLLRGSTRQRRVSMSPSQISSGITASERTRVLCSVAVAVLVVSSSLGFPLLGSDIVKGILSFRPLYLLLVTNVTIVIAAILSNNDRRGSAMVDDGAAGLELSSGSSYDWAAQASKALEISFVAKKAIEALLMDVSVYAIIVVCAFCLLR
ncbi:unnamed protein product [Linum tenue]|uniref:Uncharacterized protein n=1 Tax=Linum tenue TaxID=586396 RepID=A0AAV0M3G5_9ROSI|nr:unnamed protein product [Linum tenue]CAI0441521.1 unnamed protein product [Linum tenue]